MASGVACSPSTAMAGSPEPARMTKNTVAEPSRARRATPPSLLETRPMLIMRAMTSAHRHMRELVREVGVWQLVEALHVRTQQVVHVGAEARQERHVLHGQQVRLAVDLAALGRIHFGPGLLEQVVHLRAAVALDVAEPLRAQDLAQVLVRV